MANKFWPAIARTGGGAGSLDAIDGDDLTVADGGLVMMSTFTGAYVVIASTAAEDDPSIIIPDANPAAKRWKLV